MLLKISDSHQTSNPTDLKPFPDIKYENYSYILRQYVQQSQILVQSGRDCVVTSKVI